MTAPDQKDPRTTTSTDCPARSRIRDTAPVDADARTVTVSRVCRHRVVRAGRSGAAAVGVRIGVSGWTRTRSDPVSSRWESGSQTASSSRPVRVGGAASTWVRSAQVAPVTARPVNGTPSTYSRPCGEPGNRRSSEACRCQRPRSARQRPSEPTPLPSPTVPSTVSR